MMGTKTLAQGHVILYARDGRWRRSMAESLEQAGHSHRDAATAAEMRELLQRQTFDVLTLKVRDEHDAQELTQALEGVRMPVHGILVGTENALALLQAWGQAGDFRYVPGSLRANELSRLVEASISAGAGDESVVENGGDARVEEVDLEEAIERAAAVVYAQARRRRQRFNIVVEGPSTVALANGPRLQRILVSLLTFIVESALRSALISVEARAERDEWTVRIRASGVRLDGAAHNVDALRQHADALASASRDIRLQHGMLWVELSRAAALGVCLTLPLSEGERESN